MIDAGPQPLPGTRFTVVDDAADAGEADLTVPDASVAARAELRFETAAALDDVRIRVLTADDRLVDNRASVAIDDGGTHVVLKPLQAWPARGCCTLRVDGEIAQLPTGAGTAYLPYEASFWAQPDPNAKPPTSRPGRRHRHHR